MPEYTFISVCVLVKGDEVPLVVTHRCHSLYFHTYLEVAFGICKPFLVNGWKIQSVSLKDFDFNVKSFHDTLGFPE
jgi:hypothetical protein